MKGWLPLTLGLLAVVLGTLWTMQGLGHVGGSVMTDVTFWAVVGPIVALGGLALIVAAVRARRRGTGS